ncbi:MAG: hypothetical protein HY921_00660 [Elusimicrobia bacterium]|nr:hypothetical protein [Elusimicrobiota bacterium]
MKAKILLSGAIALILGVCPCVAALSSLAGLASPHSCCPSKRIPKDRQGHQGGDCCLRAPAQPYVSPPVPDDQPFLCLLDSGAREVLIGVAAVESDSGRPPPGLSPLAACLPRAPPALSA